MINNKLSKNAIKLLSATVAMSAILSGAPITAQAAEATPAQTTVQTKDLTKFDLLETWTYFSNPQGCPNPILVNNGNNTYTLVMYQGTQILFNVNNPAVQYPTSQVGIINYDDVCTIVSDFDELGLGDGEDYVKINDHSQLSLQGVSCGSAVINVGVWNGDIITDNVGWLPGYNITIGVFVIPAQAGAQTPVYTSLQQSVINGKAFAAAHQGEQIIGADWY
jgi:hypothetical protein